MTRLAISITAAALAALVAAFYAADATVRTGETLRQIEGGYANG